MSHNSHLIEHKLIYKYTLQNIIYFRNGFSIFLHKNYNQRIETSLQGRKMAGHWYAVHKTT